MVQVGTRLLSSGPSKANSNPPQPPSKPATAATAPKTAGAMLNQFICVLVLNSHFKTYL